MVIPSRNSVNQRTCVIAYHAIGDCPKGRDPYGLYVPVELFEKQIAYLARHREVVLLEDVSSPPTTSQTKVAITFDDGYRNNLTIAAPILERYGLKATVFVATGWLGRPSAWIDDGGSCDNTIMSAGELRQIEEMGWRVESHGHAHIDMAAASHTELTADLKASREVFRTELGREPRLLAYPWGHHSESARTVVEAAGLEAAFSIDRPDEGRFARSRVTINPLDSPFLVAMKSSPYYESVRHSRVVSMPAGLVGTLRRRRAGQEI
jgi:peptidoglycan/xylan/chitin deacetylase (PgdA/CDA1 family)